MMDHLQYSYENRDEQRFQSNAYNLVHASVSFMKKSLSTSTRVSLTGSRFVLAISGCDTIICCEHG